MKFNKPFTLSQISKRLNCQFDGDAHYKITGINEIHVAEKGDITFVDHPKYYNKALSCPASVVIINKPVDRPQGKHFLITKDPFSAFKQLIEDTLAFKKSEQLISPSAKIGKNSIIQPGTFVGDNARIGNNCIIHSNVSIYSNVEIGNNVIIHANTTIGADAFYFKQRSDSYEKFPSCGKVIIGNNVEIGCGCTVDQGITKNTIIGNGTKIDNQVHIGHDTIIGKNCLIAAQVGISGVVTIEDEVKIWGQVGIAKDLTIGKKAVVMPKTGVMRSLEGGKTYLGSPAGEINTVMRQWLTMKKMPDFIKKFKL